MTRLTIGITTRNRPEAIARCVRSLSHLQPLAPDVLVFDDDSEQPVDAPVAAAAPAGVTIRVIRDRAAAGYIAGRNRMVREANTPYVLLLDDDAVIFDAASIGLAMQVLDRDDGVVAVAFAQGESDGRPWPAGMQPSRGRHPAYVPAFIGFAHLVRRDAFLEVGGYRESLVFYGEEKDFCVRALDRGLRIVYLPDAVVGHVPDPGGRSASRYVRFVIRNDCLYSLYNEPWPLAAVSLPVRMWRYRRMSAGSDAGGLLWIGREILRSLGRLRRERRAVKWSTIREWRRLARTTVPYVPS